MSLPGEFVERAESILGSSGILQDAASIEPYTIDFWRQNRGRTDLVLRPKSTEEVAAIVRLAGEFGVALVPQSGNTGLVCGGIPDQTGTQAIISLERMNRIRHVDPAGDHLIAEAGCVLADIQNAAAEADRLFPLSLGSEGSCRIGGNLSTNAGGVNVLRYGMTRELTLGLEVVLASGEVLHGLRALRKDNTGYDLKQLFIGAEGTLGIITAASLRLMPRPREVQTIWLGIESPEDALKLLSLFQARLGEMISSFELLTGFGVEAAVTHLPDARAPLAGQHPWHLLIEIAWSLDAGLEAQVEPVLEAAFEAGLVADGTVAQNEAQRASMWRIREGQSEATRNIGSIVRTDISVPVATIPALIDQAHKRFGASHPGTRLIPFGHVGDGNLHFNFLLPHDEATFARLKQPLIDELSEMVADLGGSFSAEHGVGRSKRAELARRKSPVELAIMRQIKRGLDPKGILNPGVILEAEDA